MNSMLSRLSIILAVLLLASTQALGSSDSVKRVSVGSATVLIPSPPDLHDPSSIVPEVVEWAEMFTPQMNRLLAQFLEPEDTRMLLRGEEPSLARYALVQASRRFETTSVDTSAFARLKVQSRTDLERNIPAVMRQVDKELTDRVDTYFHSIGLSDVSIRVGDMQVLEVFDETANSISYLSAMVVALDYEGGKINSPLIGGFSVVRLKDRLVFFYLYSRYEDSDDVEWIKRQTRRWVREAITVNTGNLIREAIRAN